MTPQEILVKDLQLGDVVRSFDGPYSAATVKKIEETQVILFRPYVQTADFSYTGGVLCYIGVEEYPLWKNDTAKVTLLYRREEPLK